MYKYGGLSTATAWAVLFITQFFILAGKVELISHICDVRAESHRVVTKSNAENKRWRYNSSAGCNNWQGKLDPSTGAILQGQDILHRLQSSIIASHRGLTHREGNLTLGKAKKHLACDDQHAIKECYLLRDARRDWIIDLAGTWHLPPLLMFYDSNSKVWRKKN